MAIADACPGILDLHQARDGLVARIRLPGGYVPGQWLRALAAMARQCGDGNVDLTARGNVQLRGVPLDGGDELARRAARAGLLPSAAHDRARNVTASPLAGLAGHPDLRRLVRALDRALLADPGLAALPGRFLFCLDDGSGGAGLGRCDIGLRRRLGQADLIVAGRETGLSGPAGPMVGQALAAAREFVRQRGADPGGLTPGSPMAGVPVRTHVADLPDGGAAVAAALGGSLGGQVADNVSRLPLGRIPDAAPAVVVAAPLGRLTAAQLLLLRCLLRPGEAVRLAPAGRVVLPLAGPAGSAISRLAEAGLIVSGAHMLSAVTACSGVSCAKSLADVRSLAARVGGLAAVHWAGCGRRCGLPADASAVVATSASQFTVAALDRQLTVAAGNRP